MSRNRLTGKMLVVLAAMSMLIAACGGSDGDEKATPKDSGGKTDEVCETALNDDNSVDKLSELDFSGMEINVGSKDYVEQFVMGNLLISALEAGGAKVKDSTNLGGTQVTREALLAGEIDGYFEYTGTAWSVFLERDDVISDSAELTNAVCVEDLEKNDVRWLGVSPFNDTYGFATSADSDFPGGDLQDMADYIAENKEAKVCLEVEFPNRPDGMVLFEEATGFQIPDSQIEILETGVIYDQTASGKCTFGEIYTTDGRVPALNLKVVDDDGVFIIYNVSLTIMDDLYKKAPEAWQAVADTILAPLDNDTMAELNRQVAVDGKNPRKVADEFLASKGLI